MVEWYKTSDQKPEEFKKIIGYSTEWTKDPNHIIDDCQSDIEKKAMSIGLDGYKVGLYVDGIFYWVSVSYDFSDTLDLEFDTNIFVWTRDNPNGDPDYWTYLPTFSSVQLKN